jgi:Xaa-Pro aminopeptidase
MPWTTPPGAGATVHIWNGYSLAERDRRWRAVRDRAAEAGFDCILIPLGNGIDGRYMTQLRCSAMVLPSDGRAPIVIADRRSSNAWVEEPWQTGREWAEPMGEALLDLGMARGRIGVAGLRGGQFTHCSAIDGVVNHTALERVISKVPNATFEDATDIVGSVRYRKSDEEIAFIRQSAEVARAGLDELWKLARPGDDAAVLYAAVQARLLELRSEYFPLTLTLDPISTAQPKSYRKPPVGRRLKSTTLITNEVAAIRGAQLTQVCQPILLGKTPDPWMPVIEAQQEMFEAGLAMIKPGATFRALRDCVGAIGTKRGVKAIMQLHGCGYGDDGPLFSQRILNQPMWDLCMEEGCAFVWKPAASSADEKIQFVAGGPVLVTKRGADALFKPNYDITLVSIPS